MDVDEEQEGTSLQKENPFGINAQRVEQLVAQLNQEKAMLDKLPSTSSYVVHRLRVVSRALQLLQSDQTTGKEVSELDALLASLSLS